MPQQACCIVTSDQAPALVSPYSRYTLVDAHWTTRTIESLRRALAALESSRCALGGSGLWRAASHALRALPLGVVGALPVLLGEPRRRQRASL